MDSRSYVSGKGVTANDVEDESYQPQVLLSLSFSQRLGAFLLNIYLILFSFQNYLESNEKYYQLAHRYYMD